MINIEKIPSTTKLIESYRNDGLEYIITDDVGTRPEFIKEIFSNESEFSYLEKVFDSKDYGHNYNVKLFLIDYEEYDRIFNQP